MHDAFILENLLDAGEWPYKWKLSTLSMKSSRNDVTIEMLQRAYEHYVDFIFIGFASFTEKDLTQEYLKSCLGKKNIYFNLYTNFIVKVLYCG